MKKQAKQYSAEEKAKIALEAIKGELTIAQITAKYGVHSTQIHSWKKQAMESLVQSFKTKTKNDGVLGQEDLIKSLYEQIGQLSVERDWLKKKSELFGFKN
jgi:transposase-like protein